MKLQFGGENIPKKKTQKKLYPVTVSDWIQFLISQKNHCHSWLIGYTSMLFVLLSVILLLILNLGTDKGLLVSIPLFILFAEIVYFAFGLRPILKKSKRLLIDVMKGDKTDPIKIRDEWFEDKKEENE